MTELSEPGCAPAVGYDFTPRASAPDAPIHQDPRALVTGLTERMRADAHAIPTSDELKALTTCRGIDCRVYPADEFTNADFSIEYLVEGVLVEKQPAVVAGPAKCLKTSLAIELAVSIASGKSFLGRFGIARPSRVLFLSAESGLAVIRSTALRVCRSKDIELSPLPVFWGDWVPKAKHELHLASLRGVINAYRPEVVFIDPLYQVLDGDDAASVSKMGQQLKVVCDQCLRLDATPVLVHHTTKTSPRVQGFQPLELSDLAGAGVTEFFRQWILLNRRTSFDAEHGHQLWLSCGGSAGHASQWALDVDEQRGDQGATQWDASVITCDEARGQKREAAAEKRAQRQRSTLNKRIEQLLVAFDDVSPPRLTKTGIATKSGLSNTTVGKVIDALLQRGMLKECKVEGNNGQTYDGFELQTATAGSPVVIKT